jgi:hypothetical protein
MPTWIKHSVDLRFNSAGFTGSDLDELLPDFVTERDTNVGLTWYPSATGPESFTLAVIAAVALSAFVGEFSKKLSEDLYSWSKSKLSKVLSRKRYPDCAIVIKLDDIELLFHDEQLFDDPDAPSLLAGFFAAVPALLLSVNPAKGRFWIASHDRSSSVWTVSVDADRQ